MTVQPIPIREHYTALFEDCRFILNKSLSGEYLDAQIASHHFIADFTQWLNYLSLRPEYVLYKRAIEEYQFALLALTLGLYRQAFTALRLFLELSLAGIYYSANELGLREWLRGDQDIRWSQLIDQNQGVYSKRFARAFFEGLQETTSQYGAIAEAVYRECSEYVHGNAYTHDILPRRIEHNAHAFHDWHDKAKSVRLAVFYGLTLRYIAGLDNGTRDSLEAVILDQLGHIPEVRSIF